LISEINNLPKNYDRDHLLDGILRQLQTIVDYATSV